MTSPLLYNAPYTILIGTTPAGVTWQVYAQGKSRERVEREVAIQTARLAWLNERHAWEQSRNRLRALPWPGFCEATRSATRRDCE